ncbi:MAG TPA: GGDEF domain-containing protein [Candidatus Limnocylindria bacterium]|nr:GGDEF domain-containing protein [Candidatus Limnocylindria bacterium]
MHAQMDTVAADLGVADVLVLQRDGGRLRLLGGTGRGASWAGAVEVELETEPHAGRLMPGASPIRLRDTEPARVIGPYWATHAALVPVGDDHVVVAGSSDLIRASDAELLRHAAEAVAAVDDVSSSKLLADELEVVDAVRQLMQYRPETVRDTARHVAEVAAGALSCEFAAVLMRTPDGPMVERAGASPEECADPQLCADLQRLGRRVAEGPLVEQDLDDGSRVGRGAGLVSRYALAIGQADGRALLVVGHGAVRPRGFTSLCLRVGRALADAAEVLLSQAAAREELRAERDLFARQARTDPLTGVGNRAAWSEALEAEDKRRTRYERPVVLMNVDLDGLKQTNDRLGHDAGDELLAAAASVLRRNLRDSDVIARLGGDEFGVLLPETEPSSMPALVARVREACAAWRGSDASLRLSLSVGWAAPKAGEGLRDAMRSADEQMYLVKREA